jgi:hypothetical protein
MSVIRVKVKGKGVLLQAPGGFGRLKLRIFMMFHECNKCIVKYHILRDKDLYCNLDVNINTLFMLKHTKNISGETV